MDYFVFLCSLALLLAFGFYVAHPFFTSELQTSQRSRGEELARELVERKGQLYSAIKELEFDQALGKLSSTDFKRLRSDLEKDALTVIRQLDQINSSSDSADLRKKIEDDILSLRQNASRSITSCPNCASQSHVEDRFCSLCGTRLKEQVSP